MWIVTVGELEGFCKLIDRKGPRWVKGVLEEYDLVDAPELKKLVTLCEEYVNPINSVA